MTETRYDNAMAWVNHIDNKYGRNAVQQYLRDLKASHDELTAVVNMVGPLVREHGLAETWVRLFNSLKSAEALK